MRERRQESKVEWWKDIVDFIEKEWRKKKGRKYPWTGQDFKHLKVMTILFTQAECMALWSAYLASSPFYGPKTGYLIPGWLQERSILLDSPNFKTLVKKYEEEIGMRSPKQVVLELGL